MFLYLNKIIIIIITALVILLLLGIYFNTSRDIFETMNVFLFTNISVCLFIIFNKKIRIFLFINYFVFLSTIYGVNLYLGISSYDNQKKEGVYNQIIKSRELRKLDKNDLWAYLASPMLTAYSDLPIYPLGSFVEKKIILCEEDIRVVLKTDKYGFNNDPLVYDYNNPYIILGDSHAIGACALRENNFSSVLSQLGIKNINFAISGSSIIIQSSVFNQYIKNKINYNKVLLFLSLENDLAESKNEFYSMYNNLYTNSNNNILIDKKDEINSVLMEISDSLIVREESNTYYISKQNFRNFIFLTDLRRTMVLISLKKEFNQKNKILYDYYIPSLIKLKESISEESLIVVIIPHRAEILEKRNSEYFKTERNTLINSLKEINIQYIDMMQFYENKEKNIKNIDYYNYNGGGHFNDLGHKAVGEYIFKIMKERSL